MRYDDSTISAMIENGMDTARIQVSDYDYRKYTRIINSLYNVAGEIGAVVSIILDVPSPNRVLFLPDGMSHYQVNAGQEVIFRYCNSEECQIELMGLDYNIDIPALNQLGDDVEVGGSVVIGEEVTGEILEIANSTITVRFHNVAKVADRSRVYIDGKCRLSFTMTEKQEKDLEFASSTLR